MALREIDALQAEALRRAPGARGAGERRERHDGEHGDRNRRHRRRRGGNRGQGGAHREGGSVTAGFSSSDVASPGFRATPPPAP